MIPSPGLCLAAVAGGTITTYAYEDDAPLAWRVAAGAVSGMALLGLLVLWISLRRGLDGPTLVAAACMTSLPLLLLTSARVRARVGLDARRTRERIHRSGSGHVLRSLLVGALVLVGWRALDRVLFDLPEGMYTGYTNNFGDLPFHAGVIARFAFGDNFPPEHPSYAGAAFTYPYIADLVAASFVRCGATLRQAFLLQNALLMASVLVLLMAWFRELTRDRAAAVLACALAFLSGGLGWWMLVRELAESAGPAKLMLNLPHDYTVMNGSSWRWGNLVTALLIPQRSLLLGLPLAALIFTLLVRVSDALPNETGRTLTKSRGGWCPRRISAARSRSHLRGRFRGCCLPGVVALAALAHLVAFFALAAAVGVPQALWLAMSGSVESARFLGWHFGWGRGNNNVVAFWLRNTGLFIPLLLTHRRNGRCDCLGVHRRRMRKASSPAAPSSGVLSSGLEAQQGGGNCGGTVKNDGNQNQLTLTRSFSSVWLKAGSEASGGGWFGPFTGDTTVSIGTTACYTVDFTATA